MNRPSLTSRALLLVGLATFAAACSDTPVSVTPNVPAPLLSIQDGGASGDYVLAVSNGAYATVARRIADLGGTMVRGHEGAGIILASGLSSDAAAALSSMGGVRAMIEDQWIQGAPLPPDLQVESATATTTSGDPTDAYFWGRQWDMRVIHADDAWDAGYGGSPSVTVAIIDTGIDPYHQDLAGLVDWDRSIAFVASVNPLGPPWGDDYFHGTHVAGTVASNGLGTWGVAPQTTLVAVKVCNSAGSCPLGAIFSGILYAADIGANVGNLSLGGFIAKNETGGGQLSAIYNQVVDYATRKGMLVVAAAGNDGVDLDHLGRDYHAGSYTGVPCEAGNAVCVSATGPLDVIAGYSNYGVSAVNVAAPGGDGASVGSLYGEVIAPCSTLTVLSGLAPCTTSPTYYVWAQGTSMAAPHVTGAAALLAAMGLTNPAALVTALQQTADDLGKTGTDPLYGKGRINVYTLVNTPTVARRAKQ